MKKQFTLGAISGISALALSVPLLSGVSSAASVSSATNPTATKPQTRVVPGSTVASVQTLIDHDAAFLNSADALVSAEKSATEAHKAALTQAALLTDTTAREAAVKAANETMRASIQSAISANPDLKKGMFGMGRHSFDKRGGRGFENTTALATKLGMTEADLKAALQSGKTIQQIAAEKGITLPVRPAHMNAGTSATTQSTSAQ